MVAVAAASGGRPGRLWLAGDCSSLDAFVEGGDANARGWRINGGGAKSGDARDCSARWSEARDCGASRRDGRDCCAGRSDAKSGDPGRRGVCRDNARGGDVDASRRDEKSGGG